MRITTSLPGFYEKSVSPNSNRIADERGEQSLQIAEQLNRIGQEFKVNSLLTNSNKQAAAQKAAVLKQRLDRLKAMMRFATPQMAKALARELKSIAKELASVARVAGTSDSGTTSTVATPAGEATDNVSAEAQTGSSTAAAAADEAASAESGNAVEGSGDQNADAEAGATADTRDAERASGGVGIRAGSDDKSLRELVQEARKLLKELIARVKSLARAGNADARRDLQAAERSVAELDRALDPGGSQIAAIDVDSGATLALGGNIDVSV